MSLWSYKLKPWFHYNDVIMGTITSQITSLTIVYSTVYSDADQRKHQSTASLAFVRGIHRGPVNSPRKWPVTWKMFPFDDVIMLYGPLDLRPIGSATQFSNGSLVLHIRVKMLYSTLVLVLRPIGFMTHWSYQPLVRRLIGPWTCKKL